MHAALSDATKFDRKDSREGLQISNVQDMLPCCELSLSIHPYTEYRRSRCAEGALTGNTWAQGTPAPGAVLFAVQSLCAVCRVHVIV
jgi:hypothetical protein